MRILIFNWKDSAHPAAGGAEVFTEQVAHELVQRGHDVTLFAAEVRERPSRERINGIGVIRQGSRLGVYRAARRFWKRQPANAYDVVVDEINTRPFLTPKWVRGTPVVALIHQLAREIWRYELPFPASTAGRYVLEPWWLRTYRDVPALTVSQSSADSLIKLHGWRDVTIVPEGSVPHPIPDVDKEADPTIVFLGRLVAMKRPGDALEAFSRLREDIPAAKLWIIGDGPLLPRLRGSAPDGVTFTGRLERPELLERLARAHVLVATSVREGWGLNVSEAAACGTPSIGYRVAGLIDSVPSSGGALVDDDPAALAVALRGFFQGRLRLTPKISTVPWDEVADAVERRLRNAVANVC